MDDDLSTSLRTLRSTSKCSDCDNKVISRRDAVLCNIRIQLVFVQKVLRTCRVCGDSFCLSCVKQKTKKDKNWKMCNDCIDENYDSSDSDSQVSDHGAPPRDPLSPKGTGQQRSSAAAANPVPMPMLEPKKEPGKGPEPDEQHEEAGTAVENANNDKSEEEGLCIESWSVKEVFEYFSASDSSDVAYLFTEKQIDGKALLLITRDDVIRYFDLNLGPAIRLFEEINELKKLTMFSYD